MICPFCGSEVNEAGFCSQCGGPLPKPEREQPERSAEPRPSSSAFVLVIVGLVLSVLLATCIPGLICSAVGLFLNMRQSKQGIDNPRKTVTNVLGVVGLVVGVIALVAAISIAVTAKHIVDTVNENGWSMNNIDITVDPDGSIVVREIRSSSVSDRSSASSSSSVSSGSSKSAESFDSACLDEKGNPTLYAVFELGGSEFQGLLTANGFKWYDSLGAWMRNDNAICEIMQQSGSVSKEEAATYPAGADGKSVVFVLAAEGYASPTAALEGLGANVVIDRKVENSGTLFSVAKDKSGSQYLVLVSETGVNEQTMLVYNEASIRDGLFLSTIGIDVGATIDDAWKVITG